MGNRIEAKTTPVSPAAMQVAMSEAWRRYFGYEPSPKAVRVLLAHWALETAWGRSMVCFNVGNVKAFDTHADYDYCYFSTWEILPVAQAEAYVRAHPTTARITGTTENGRHARLQLYPDDPGCRFKAYATLADGCAEHLPTLHNRFSRCWPAVLSGDPAEFSRALKSMSYYTADEPTYTRLMKANFATLENAAKDPPTPAPDPPSTFKAPLSSDAFDDMFPPRPAPTEEE